MPDPLSAARRPLVPRRVLLVEIERVDHPPHGETAGLRVTGASVPIARDNVFFEVWRLCKRVRIVDGSLLPWLLAVTTRVSFNLSRSQRRYARMIAQLPPAGDQIDHSIEVDERIENEGRAAALMNAIGSLSPGDRAVVELCLIEELPMTTAAAAAALDLPVGTVKSRLHRARRHLRTKLGDPDISIEPVTPNPNERRLT